MIVEKQKLLNLLIIQGLVCFLIPLWGMAMLAVGVIGRNPTWIGLGFVVLFAGLPFARNALRNNGSSNSGILS
jgi:hypothetical protein